MNKIKRRIYFSLFLAAVFGIFLAAGRTVKADNPIVISTVTDFQKMQGSYYGQEFYLANDIDMGPVGLWTPIEDFQGNFNGGGHKIKNLTSQKGGLFKNITKGANISNVELENVNIVVKGYTYGYSSDTSLDTEYNVGALVGTIKEDEGTTGNTTTIQKCSVSGSVSYYEMNRVALGGVGSSAVGGLVGEFDAFGSEANKGLIMITECSSTADVSADGLLVDAGGIIGVDYGTTVSNCMAAGKITAFSNYTNGGTAAAGGLVGTNYGGKLYNSYSRAAASASGSTYHAGNIIAYADYNSYLYSSYSNGSVGVGTNPSGLVKGKLLSDQELKNKDSFSGWDFDKVWGINTKINDGYPILQWMQKNYKLTAPTASVAPGRYEDVVNVELKTEEEGVVIYYTLDGSVPTANSLVYTTPIQVSISTTVKAVVAGGSFQDSDTAVFEYTMVSKKPTANLNSGKIKRGKKLALSAEIGTMIYYTTDGSIPNENDVKYSGPIKIKKKTSFKIIAVSPGREASEVLELQFKIKKKK